MTGLDRQLAPVAEAMARELRTGSGVIDALAAAGAAAGGVAGRDIAVAIDLLDAGESTPHVFRGWVRHRRSPGLAVLVALLLVALETGGDVSNALDSFAAGRRDEDDLAGELRALTSQARASAAFLVGLPVVAAVGLAFVEPATASFLGGTLAGRGCLALALVLDGVAWWTMSTLARRVPMRPASIAIRALLPVVDVVRLGLAAGLRPPAALDQAARQLAGLPSVGPPELDAYLLASRRGVPFTDAARSWAESTPGPARELVELLLSAHASGTTIVPGLDRLAHDLRRRHRQDAQERARRLPVLLVVPLVLCVMPAFGLVAVVPMLAVGLDALRVSAG